MTNFKIEDVKNIPGRGIVVICKCPSLVSDVKVDNKAYIMRNGTYFLSTSIAGIESMNKGNFGKGETVGFLLRSVDANSIKKGDVLIV